MPLRGLHHENVYQRIEIEIETEIGTVVQGKIQITILDVKIRYDQGEDQDQI